MTCEVVNTTRTSEKVPWNRVPNKFLRVECVMSSRKLRTKGLLYKF